MTKEEAKTKWCPFAMGWDKYGSYNRQEGGQSSAKTLCIASACMAWHWTGYRATDGTWVRKTAEGPWSPNNADGFCGLAGGQQQKPHPLAGMGRMLTMMHAIIFLNLGPGSHEAVLFRGTGTQLGETKTYKNFPEN